MAGLRFSQERPNYLSALSSRPTRQAHAYSDAVTEAGGVMPTGGAFSTANNRYLQKYQNTIQDPEEQVALTAAMGLQDQTNKRAQAAGANPMTGGYQWQPFEDFHDVRKQQAALTGDRYRVGGISGGGDVNSRVVSGGPTPQRSGGSMNGSMDYLDKFHRRELMRQQREAGEMTLDNMRRARTDASLAALDKARTGPGTQGADDRLRHTTAMNEEMTDFGADRAATRYFDPRISAVRRDALANDIEKSTAPARVQNEGLLDRTNRTNQNEMNMLNRRLNDPVSVLQNWMDSISRGTEAGLFGRDANNFGAPPPGVRNRANEVANQAMGGDWSAGLSQTDRQYVMQVADDEGIPFDVALDGLRRAGVLK